MQFEVRLFAYQRERFGDAVTVDCEPTVGAVLAALSTLGLDAQHARLAIDEAFAEGGEKLRAESRLALIPPVSGG
jgi:molybdopterin converting factor small subunit